MKAKKLPELMYAKWNGDSLTEDAPFMEANTDAGELLSKGESMRVGVYRLVGYADLRNETAISVKMNKKK